MEVSRDRLEQIFVNGAFDDYNNSDLVLPDNGVKFNNGIGGNRMILVMVSREPENLKCKGNPNSSPLQGNSGEDAFSIDEWNNKR